MIWASRSRTGPDRFLDWKIRLFFAGAVLALIGMATGRSWMVGFAIGVLVAGLVLSFLSKRSPDADPGEPDRSDGIEPG